MQEYFTHMDHKSPLFQECLPLLLKEHGEGHRITEPGIGLEIWNVLKHDRICRYQGVVVHAIKDVQQWTKLFLGMTYCVMQLGAITDDMPEQRTKHMDEERAQPNNGKTTTSRDEKKEENVRQFPTTTLQLLACTTVITKIGKRKR